MTQWKTKSVSLTTYDKMKVNFSLSELITKQIVMREFHVENSTESSYNMKLCRDILTAL